MMIKMKNMTETKNDDYKRGYREGFLDGFHAARDNDSLMSPNIPIPMQCGICGMRTDAPMGLVCFHPNCPTKVTCK